MKNFKYYFFAFALLCSCGENIKKKQYNLPQEKLGELFLKTAALDSLNAKSWADAIPGYDASLVLEDFQNEKPSNVIKFVKERFRFTDSLFVHAYPKESLKQYSERALLSLVKKSKDDGGSQIPTRKPFVAGGGYFNEYSGWESFFTYFAFKSLGKKELCEGTILNYLQFIQDFGHVPLGNRTYLLTEAPIPLVSFLIEDYTQKDPAKLAEYTTLLSSEYQYYMASNTEEDRKQSSNFYKNTVKLGSNDILNRYFVVDSNARSDHYKNDLQLLKWQIANRKKANLQGFYMPERWINQHDILPVELNSALFHLENLISRAYEQKNLPQYVSSFNNLKGKRRKKMNDFFWQKDRFLDYDYSKSRRVMEPNAGEVFTILSGVSSTEQSNLILARQRFNADGLIVFNGIVNIELNTLFYMAAKKALHLDLATKLKANILRFANVKYTQEGSIKNLYGTKEPHRIDGALGSVVFLLNDQM